MLQNATGSVRIDHVFSFLRMINNSAMAKDYITYVLSATYMKIRFWPEKCNPI
jgi:hypothetical protein